MHTFSGRCSAEFQCLLYLVDIHIISGITYDFSADWYVYNITQYFTQWEEFKKSFIIKNTKGQEAIKWKRSWDQQNMTYCAWSLCLGCPSPTAASLKFSVRPEGCICNSIFLTRLPSTRASFSFPAWVQHHPFAQSLSEWIVVRRLYPSISALNSVL